jgi:methionine synthase II (cobalamin-independent)
MVDNDGTLAPSGKVAPRADIVGSLLRPPALLAARELHASGKISSDQLRKVEDASIEEVIELQESLALPVAYGFAPFTMACSSIRGKVVTCR